MGGCMYKQGKAAGLGRGLGKGQRLEQELGRGRSRGRRLGQGLELGQGQGLPCSGAGQGVLQGAGVDRDRVRPELG